MWLFDIAFEKIQQFMFLSFNYTQLQNMPIDGKMVEEALL